MIQPDGPPIDPTVPPSGEGCAECTATEGWWFHLRRCATCGHIGCCDSSPAQHATAHWRATGHPVMQSFEPGEDWGWHFVAEDVRIPLATYAFEKEPVPGAAVFGIRPEHVAFNSGSGWPFTATANVVVVEPMGSDTLVWLKANA